MHWMSRAHGATDTQQFRVFGMLCSGRLNKQIAYDLQIAEATVKAHMTPSCASSARPTARRRYYSPVTWCSTERDQTTAR